MDNIEIAISIISAAISLIAVITAICLSVIPEIVKSIRQKNISRIRIRHVFRIIDCFFDEYRFYNTTKLVANNITLLAFDLTNCNYKIDIISLLESIKEDIVFAKYKDHKYFYSIYYKCFEVFSGFPKPILQWYILETNIIEYFKFSNESKKYWLFEKEKMKEDSSLLYHCYACGKKYKHNEVLDLRDMNEVEKRMHKILGTEICIKDRIPMHLMEEKKPFDLSKIKY